jgi:predicted Zn finger-like uncharacterized protein
MLDQVEVFCPHCFANYFVSPERVPEDGVKTPCKKCSKSFTMIKASGDPKRDRASRQQGFVVIQPKKRPSPEEEANGYYSREVPRRKSEGLALSGLLRKKSVQLGLCVAGGVLLIVLGGFYLWKSSIHGRLEKGLRDTLARASTSRFEVKVQDITFSLLGGTRGEKGCFYGLALNDREARKILAYVDTLYFHLDPSTRQFITEPFSLRVNVCNSKIVLNGCVVEAGGAEGWQGTFRAKDGTAELEGMDVLTGQGLEIALGFKGGEWSTDPQFILGNVDLGLKLKQLDSLSGSISKNVDLRFALKNGIFPKHTRDPKASSENDMDALITKWAEIQTVATMNPCSLNLFGSTVEMAAKLEFQKPPQDNELGLSFKAKDFSRIMKFIHRINREVFNKIVVTLVDLDEKNVGLYTPNTDTLDLNLSYRTSKIKINEQELHANL